MMRMLWLFFQGVFANKGQENFDAQGCFLWGCGADGGWLRG